MQIKGGKQEKDLTKAGIKFKLTPTLLRFWPFEYIGK